MKTRMLLNEWTELILDISITELHDKIYNTGDWDNIITVFCDNYYNPCNDFTVEINKEIKLNLKRYLFFYEL